MQARTHGGAQSQEQPMSTTRMTPTPKNENKSKINQYWKLSPTSFCSVDGEDPGNSLGKETSACVGDFTRLKRSCHYGKFCAVHPGRKVHSEKLLFLFCGKTESSSSCSSADLLVSPAREREEEVFLPSEV